MINTGAEQVRHEIVGEISGKIILAKRGNMACPVWNKINNERIEELERIKKLIQGSKEHNV